MSTKKERSEIYNTKEWLGLRNSVLKRDGYLCQVCAGNRITKAAEIVHHIKEIRKGGDPFDKKNCISVCRQCHSDIHSRPKDPQVLAWENFINKRKGVENEETIHKN